MGKQKFVTINTERLLEENELLRGNDMTLFYEYCCDKGIKTAEEFRQLFLDNAFRESYNIPTFESISRARRSIQQHRSDLKPSKKIQELRAAKEEEFREEYSRG